MRKRRETLQVLPRTMPDFPGKVDMETRKKSACFLINKPTSFPFFLISGEAPREGFPKGNPNSPRSRSPSEYGSPAYRSVH